MKTTPLFLFVILFLMLCACSDPRQSKAPAAQKNDETLNQNLLPEISNPLSSPPLETPSLVKWENEKQKLVAIQAEEIPLSHILEALFALKHQNIIVSTEVHADVTLHLTKVPWQEAVNTLLDIYQCGQLQTHHITYIAPRAELNMNENNQTLITHVFALQFIKTEALAHVISQSAKTLLSDHGSFITDERSNHVIVMAPFSKMPALKQLVRLMDIPSHQVLIKARIVDIDKNAEKELGIDFGVRSSMNKTSSENLPTIASEFNGGINGVATARVTRSLLLDMKLTALENEGKGNIISSPRLMTANQQTASIEAGEEIPYQQAQGEGVTSVAFRKAVLRLSFTPEIHANNTILLALKMNQDKRSANTLIQGTPSIETEQMSTQVMIKSGETLILGGISQQLESHGNSSIPFLGNLPLIGGLFRHSQTENSNRELLIFVTPEIV